MRRLFLFGALTLTSWTTSLFSAELTLVDAGKATAVIVLSADAPWIDRHAANELSHFIQRMTGTELPIVDVLSPAVVTATTRILIGRQETNPLIRELVDVGKLSLSKSEPGGDGFTVKTVQHDSRQYLILGGSRGRGNLYAVYDFLEEDCGVGYFWDGDQVPQQRSLRFSSINRVERPYFSRRMAPNACSYVYSCQYWDVAAWKRAHDYMAKRKLNFSYFTLGREVVMNRVWKRFGMQTAEPSAWHVWEAQLQKEVRAYAEKLDMDTVGQLWGGHVSPEFAAAYPDLKYVVTEWAGVNTSYNIHPTEPMFREVARVCIEEWQKAYGPTHIWDQAPYPETSPGATDDDKRQIKLDWARNMTAAIQSADPQGVLYMSGWFLQGDDWTPAICREFFAAMPKGRFVVSDAWAETKPVYPKTGYFGGQAEWMFGVLNTFGNVERLHGDVADLISRVQRVLADPQAEHCTGFYIDPESTHHNFLYFDLATELAWDPSRVELEDFLRRYCQRRYGAKSAAAMLEAWKLVAGTAYADNIEANPRPSYHNPLPRDGGGTELFAENDKIQLRLGHAPALKKALELACGERVRLAENSAYQRDVLDIGRTLLGILFDGHAYRAHVAFTGHDAAALAAEGAATLRILVAIEELIASRREFFLEEEMKLGRQLPTRTQLGQSVRSALSAFQEAGSVGHPNDHEIRVRFTALAGMDKYPGLLDYAAADRVELLRGYYRPRVQAWLDQMHAQLDVGTIDYGSLLSGPYKQLAQSFVAGKQAIPPWDPAGKPAADVAASLLEKLRLPTIAN